jgi:hypothetical protein
MSGRTAIETHAASAEVAVGGDRAFGGVFTAVFLVVALWPLTGADGAVRWWALAVSGVLAGVSLLRPRLLHPLNRVWFRFGLLLHKVVSPLVMSTLFFVVITPVGLLMRGFGTDPLRRRFDAQATTYWILRAPPGPDPDSLRDQF